MADLTVTTKDGMDSVTDVYRDVEFGFTCDVSFCDQRAAVIHNGVKLCRSHHDDPEWAV